MTYSSKIFFGELVAGYSCGDISVDESSLDEIIWVFREFGIIPDLMANAKGRIGDLSRVRKRINWDELDRIEVFAGVSPENSHQPSLTWTHCGLVSRSVAYMCSKAGSVSTDEMMRGFLELDCAKNFIYGYSRAGSLYEDLVFGELGALPWRASNSVKKNISEWAAHNRGEKFPKKLWRVFETNFFRPRMFFVDDMPLEEWIAKKSIGSIAPHEKSGLLVWRCCESDIAAATAILIVADLLVSY